MGLLLLIALIVVVVILDRYKRPTEGMRLSSKFSIGGFAGWFLFNVLANVSAPSGLDDPGFEGAVATASSLQTIGSVLLVLAIVTAIVTVYTNLADKPGVAVHGDYVHGHKVSGTSGVVAIGNHNQIQSGSGNTSTRRDTTTNTQTNNSAYTDSLNTLHDFVSSSNSPDKDEILSLINQTKAEIEKPDANQSSILELIKRIVTMAEKIGPIIGLAKEAFDKLKAAT